MFTVMGNPSNEQGILSSRQHWRLTWDATSCRMLPEGDGGQARKKIAMADSVSEDALQAAQRAYDAGCSTDDMNTCPYLDSVQVLRGWWILGHIHGQTSRALGRTSRERNTALAEVERLTAQQDAQDPAARLTEQIRVTIDADIDRAYSAGVNCALMGDPNVNPYPVSGVLHSWWIQGYRYSSVRNKDRGD